MDFLVLSHLRWNFVFQRPQQLMSRCAKDNRVFFWEEPVFDSESARLEVATSDRGVKVVLPHLPQSVMGDEARPVLQSLILKLLEEYSIRDYALWFYTPLANHFTRELKPRLVIYDCMDELSAFRDAPPGLRESEAELFRRADLIFTGGQSLYEAKKTKHFSVHCFPSSIDYQFFSSARRKIDSRAEPADQAAVPKPRLGYCGVIDERMDLNLLSSIADARPDWNLIMIGPVVKIGLSDLPQRRNIHFLGGKPYVDLPLYMNGWNVGLLPFSLNESTKFISPTKTPEYLAAGLPVVSTPITDVVCPYGERGFVRIAEGASDFITAIEATLERPRSADQMAELDRFLGENSWDRTWRNMEKLIDDIGAPQINGVPLRGPKELHAGTATSRRKFASGMTAAMSSAITNQE